MEDRSRCRHAGGRRGVISAVQLPFDASHPSVAAGRLRLVFVRLGPTCDGGEVDFLFFKVPPHVERYANACVSEERRVTVTPRRPRQPPNFSASDPDGWTLQGREVSGTNSWV